MRQSLLFSIGVFTVLTACGGGGSTTSSSGGSSNGGAAGSSHGSGGSAGSSHGSGGSAGSSHGSGGSAGSSSHACAGTTCPAGNVCVAYRTVGGVLIRPDANGKCPSGSHVEGTNCVADFAYECVPLSGCFGNAPINCACAMLNIADTAGTCPTGYPHCTDPSPTTPDLDPNAKLICEQLVP